MNSADLKSYTVLELKGELQQRSLEVTGKKADLIARLAPVLEEEAAAAAAKAAEEKAAAEAAEAERLAREQEEQARQEAQADAKALANGQAELGDDPLDEQVPFAAGEQEAEPPQAPSAEPTTAADVKTEEAKPERREEKKDEYQTMEVPVDWRPCPLIRARNVSQHKAVTEADIQDIVEEAGFDVRSVHFDTVSGGRVAYIRLEPPGTVAPAAAEPMQQDNGVKAEPDQKPELPSDPLHEDVTQLAEAAARKLQALDPPPKLKEELLAFDSPGGLSVELFVANLTPEWEAPETFRTAMDAQGSVVRCFIMRNPEGESKGYGFVEFATPAAASRAKSMMEKIEAEMRPDFRGSRGGEGRGKKGPGDRWQQVKLQRAEWSRPHTVFALFGRVLYVSNLPQGFEDAKLLHGVFDQFGRVTECHLPRNKQTGHPKGFGFIEYKTSRHADRAFRALAGIDHPKLGKFLVSFANPAKPSELSGNQGRDRPQGGMRLSGTRPGGGGGGDRRDRDRRDSRGPRGMGGGRDSRGFGGADGMRGGGRSGGYDALPSVPMGSSMGSPMQQQQFNLQRQAQMQMQMRGMAMGMQPPGGGGMAAQQAQQQQQQQYQHMQAQIRAAQLQAQAATQAAALATAQAQAANRRAVAEAEARQKAEEERKLAQRAQQMKAQAAQQLSMSQQYGGGSGQAAGYGYGSYSQSPAAGGGSGAYGASGGYGEGGYGGSGGSSARAAASSQGYGTGYGQGYGSTEGGMGAASSSYMQGYGGSSSGYDTGYGGQGTYEGSGYEAPSSYTPSAGQKRSSTGAAAAATAPGGGSGDYYSQARQGYGSGNYSSYGGHQDKRQRY